MKLVPPNDLGNIGRPDTIHWNIIQINTINLKY